MLITDQNPYTPIPPARPGLRRTFFQLPTLATCSGSSLDGDGAVQTRVDGLGDLTHAALAGEGGHVVVAEVESDLKGRR